MSKHRLPLPDSANPGPTATGTILIRDKDQNPCHLSAPPPGSGGVIVFSFTHSESPCNNDTARTVQFAEFPSATTVYFYDTGEALETDDQNFWFEVKTTRKRTSTEILNLENFNSYQPGDIIEPGLRLIRKYRKNNNAPIRDALSSVCIHSATAPPTVDGTDRVDSLSTNGINKSERK